jgi:hypothetical protein
LKKLPPFVLLGVLLNTSFSGVAKADDWACEVLLCLSNPKGAMAVAPCVPPISKLWRKLAKGHVFRPVSWQVASGNCGNSAAHPFTDANYGPSNDLTSPQFDGDTWHCALSGAVKVNIQGRPASRVWWSGEDSYTEPLDSGSADVGARANAGSGVES